MKTHFTITPFWDARVKDEKGISRIMLTVNLNRKQFSVSLKLKATKEDYQKA